MWRDLKDPLEEKRGGWGQIALIGLCVQALEGDAVALAQAT